MSIIEELMEELKINRFNRREYGYKKLVENSYVFLYNRIAELVILLIA